MRRWRERKTVFVPNELSNLRIRPVKVLVVLREIDAAAADARKFAQVSVGRRETLLDGPAVRFFLTGQNFVLQGLAEIAGKGDGQDSNVAGFQFLLDSRPFCRR